MMMFLASDSLVQTGCLILDFAMPGMNGFDLQRELKLRGHSIPIIFISAHKDEVVRSGRSGREPLNSCSSHSATRPCFRR